MTKVQNPPGLIENSIKNKLLEEFSPLRIEVINESHKHNVPPGSESHFKLLVVSKNFEGVRKIQRQQQVYRVLADEIAGPVHALTMQTLTPEEWEQNPSIGESPDCMGGSKA